MYLSRALPISTLLLVVALQQVYAKTNLAQMSVLEIEDAIQVRDRLQQRDISLSLSLFPESNQFHDGKLMIGPSNALL